jgi:hypothetical protein
MVILVILPASSKEKPIGANDGSCRGWDKSNALGVQIPFISRDKAGGSDRAGRCEDFMRENAKAELRGGEPGRAAVSGKQTLRPNTGLLTVGCACFRDGRKPVPKYKPFPPTCGPQCGICGIQGQLLAPPRAHDNPVIRPSSDYPPELLHPIRVIVPVARRMDVRGMEARTNREFLLPVNDTVTRLEMRVHAPSLCRVGLSESLTSNYPRVNVKKKTKIGRRSWVRSNGPAARSGRLPGGHFSGRPARLVDSFSRFVRHSTARRAFGMAVT